MREGREEDDGKEIRLAFEEESSVGMKVKDIKKERKGKRGRRFVFERRDVGVNFSCTDYTSG
jgi:hypothetical protein